MSDQENVQGARMVAPPCYPFELSPLNELYKGKLVSTIIVIIPYLLAVTLSIISSNLYTRLAVCNCLSITFRSGNLPSILIIPQRSQWDKVLASSVRPSIPFVHPSVHTFCLSGTISQYLSVRFDSFLVQIISTINSQYHISLVKIDPLTLELLPLFWYRQL